MSELLDTQTRGHHPDSPSSLQSTEACAKFENEQRESQASLDGTLQHKAAETRDLSILDGDVEMENAVNECLQYEDEAIGALRDLQGGLPAVVRELYLAVGDDFVIGNEGHKWLGVTGGFPDTLILGHSDAAILDWKFGKVPVTPTKDNRQGQAYALGVFHKYPHIQRVTVHFKAPYQGFTKEEHFKKYVHTFTREDIPRLELEIRTIIALKKNPDAVATPKQDLCIWCAKKGNCAALHAIVLKGSSKHPDFIVPEVVDHVQLTVPQQIKKAFLWATQLETIAKAIKRRTTDMVLTEGLELGDDVKLVKRQERVVKSVPALIELAKENGVTQDQINEIIWVPITKIEAAIKTAAGKGKGAAALREFTQKLSESGVTELGKPIHFLQEVKSPAEKAKLVIEVVADRDDTKKIQD